MPYLGCDGCPAPGLAGYLGQEEIPWWQRLIQTGEQIATAALTPNTNFPTYTPPFNSGPYLPSVYGPPAPAPAEEESIPWLPLVLIGGLALFWLSRRKGG